MRNGLEGREDSAGSVSPSRRTRFAFLALGALAAALLAAPLVGAGFSSSHAEVKQSALVRGSTFDQRTSFDMAQR